MHISRISTINFSANNTAIIKNTAKKADKEAADFIKECLEPANGRVDYNLSAYSIPTGEMPLEHLKTKRHPFTPDDNVIANKYLEAKKISEPAEEAVDYVSESRIY